MKYLIKEMVKKNNENRCYIPECNIEWHLNSIALQ